MSFGTRARFKWRGESCPDSETDSCWLDHGDLLVMDGQCQDEFLHCTDPVHQITGKCATVRDGIIRSTGYCWKLLYMPVLERLPSLHDDYAYMVSWNNGHSGEIAGRHVIRPLFPLLGFFSSVETLFIGSGVLSCGIFGLVGPDILDLNPWESRLSCSMSVVGSLMVILL